MRYKTIVYGATLKGLGIAARSPKDTLILESSGTVAHEFASALRFSEFSEQVPKSDFSLAVYNELNARNAVDNGVIHVPVLPAILMKLIKDFDLNIIFSSALLSRQKQADEILVTTLFHHNAMQYFCQTFVDTTTDFDKLIQHGIHYDVGIGAMLYDCDVDGCLDQEQYIHKIGNQQLFSLRLPVQIDRPFDEYRNHVFTHVQQLLKTHPGVKLLHIGDTLDVRSSDGNAIIQEDIGIYAPSCASRTVMEAIEEGEFIGGNIT